MMRTLCTDLYLADWMSIELAAMQDRISDYIIPQAQD
jgi:hypothetical protein